MKHLATLRKTLSVRSYMFRTVYDYQIFSRQRYGGISRYIYELAKHLSKHSDFDIKILAFACINEYIKKADPKLVLGFPIPKIRNIGTILDWNNRQLSKIWLQNNTPHIIHETFYRSQGLTPKHVKTVLTVHDMIDEKFYTGSEMSYKKAAAVKRADHIICVSENTKNDLIDILSVNPNKISVVYHGCSLSENVPDETSSEEVCIAPYILYVGDRYGYKNFEGFLQAYASSKHLNADFKLVCFGGIPFMSKELAWASELGIPEGNLLHMSGDDSLLIRLYKGASAFVYPSLCEGFGIPLLEAMSLRCPVVCSNTSSIPEVVGDAAELFDPYSFECMINSLEKVLYSTQRAEELRILGAKRAKHFSWEKCAEQTREVYLSLI